MKKYKRVYIEITNVCNLSCSFCPLNKRAKKFMDPNSFGKILREVSKFTDYIYLHLMGEPLLNKDLESFLDIAKKEGIKVNITTNGTLIKNNKEVLLNSSALRQINISLHSFEANKEDTSVIEYLDDVISLIREASDKTQIISSMRLWNLDGEKTVGENRLNNMVCKYIEESFSLDFSIEEKLKKEKRIKLMDRVYLNCAEKFNWPDMSIEPLGDRGFCYGLRDHFGILVDGTVVPCCLDGEGEIPLGNVFNESLEEILESQRAKAIYQGFSSRKRVEELCKRCGYSETFNK